MVMYHFLANLSFYLLLPLAIQDHNTRLQTIKSLINQLPKVNHGTLKAIISHLTK